MAHQPTEAALRCHVLASSPVTLAVASAALAPFQNAMWTLASNSSLPSG